MKKVFIISLCTLSLFAADGEKQPFTNMQPPSIKSPCNEVSFSVYKDTVCNGSGFDLISLRCLELGTKKILGILSDDEVKHYTGNEAVAYLEERRNKKCSH